MSEGVIPDLVAFIVDALGDARELVGLNSDQEKSCGSMLSLQNVENLGRPLRIGPVVERDDDLMGTEAVTAHTIRFGQRLEVLVRDEAVIRVNRQVACAVRGPVFDAQNLALAL